MSHDEERVNGAGIWDKHARAPRHWLNPLVGLFACRNAFEKTQVTKMENRAAAINPAGWKLSTVHSKPCR